MWSNGDPPTGARARAWTRSPGPAAGASRSQGTGARASARTRIRVRPAAVCRSAGPRRRVHADEGINGPRQPKTGRASIRRAQEGMDGPKTSASGDEGERPWRHRAGMGEARKRSSVGAWLRGAVRTEAVPRATAVSRVRRHGCTPLPFPPLPDGSGVHGTFPNTATGWPFPSCAARPCPRPRVSSRRCLAPSCAEWSGIAQVGFRFGGPGPCPARGRRGGRAGPGVVREPHAVAGSGANRADREAAVAGGCRARTRGRRSGRRARVGCRAGGISARTGWGEEFGRGGRRRRGRCCVGGRKGVGAGGDCAPQTRLSADPGTRGQSQTRITA